MIKRATIFSFFFLVLLTSGIVFKIFYPSKEITNITKTLTEEIIIPNTEKKYPNKQIRNNVSKDLWFSKNEKERLHHHIESPRSILIAIPNKNRMEFVERMINMQCYFQEKIEEGKGKTVQTIRYLQSENGTYHYTGHSFDAHSVFLALYRMPGKTLPIQQLDIRNAYLKGIAEEVTLSFSEGTPNLRAEKFKAQVKPQGTIK